MKFNKIEEKDFNTLFLNNISEKKGKEEKYLKRYNAYRELFTQYLINKLDLLKYDSDLEESKLGFISIEQNQMDVYQYFTADTLKYFYLRNNIYIEKLTQEEMDNLDKIIEENKIELNEQNAEFIEKTYKKTIFEDVAKDGRDCIILYGPDSGRFLAQNNSIIIGFRYDEFNKANLSEEEWFQQNNKQQDFLYNLIQKMEKELNAKNKSVPVKIIKYNEFSTIPRV